MLVQDMCTVCAKRTIGSEVVSDPLDGIPRWTWLKWKLILVHLGIVRILRQDRCMVCAERTIGSENVFDASDGTPR